MKLCVVFLCFLVFRASLCEDEEDDGEFAANYLAQYNYISNTRSGNHDPKTALKNFQAFFGIPVTGQLDEETLYQMKKPRCGVPDVGSDGARMKRFSTWRGWRKTTLKYYMSYGGDLSQADQSRIIARAFKYWSDVAPRLSFSRTYTIRDADLRLSWGKRRHSGVPGDGPCNSPFDGKGKVLAHAFYPENGRLHFDEDDKFTENGSFWNGSYGLLYVAVHEIGHALGLRHSDVKGAVMWPTAERGAPKLSQDDIAGIRSLYA